MYTVVEKNESVVEHFIDMLKMVPHVSEKKFDTMEQ